MPKPEWLSIPLVLNQQFQQTKETVKELGMVTVCEEAHCPNLNECWSGGTATFMVMGDTCTRGCRFCHVKTAFKPAPLDTTEPQRLAEAVKRMNLDYVVVTSVDRDELPDQGAAHFAECISEIRKQNPKTLIEVLTPDFRGNEKCIQTVLEAKPTVFAHNLETVKRLQSSVRDFRAGYEQSLGVLKFAKQAGARFTKSSLMLGLGEEREEVLQAMEDLRNAGVDILTLGQYLRPSQNHLLVARYVTPAEFKDYEKEGLKRGFAFVAAGPFVRSSYRAGELFVKNIEFKRS